MAGAKIQSLNSKVRGRIARRILGLLTLGFGLWTCHAPANPTGMTVASGSATASQNGSQLAITASQNAFLNWQSFNIAAGETTLFNQPSAQSIVWNRVNDPNPSLIYGSLQANGVVVLMNSAGFYFGPNSFVQAAGLIVSTAQAMPQNNGGAWEFNGPPPAASIINYGKINIVNGGSAFLIAENVANFGDIAAPDGTIGIAAGQDVLVSERPDGRGLSMKVTLPKGSVDNEGRLVADAGTISVNAQVVNQDGIVQANAVRNVNGVIELVASDELNLGANSQIVARGDDSSPGSGGGAVTLQSGSSFSDATGSGIDVGGGAQGGNGGNVEISAPSVLSLNSSIDAGALSGWSGGAFLLDPQNITLGYSGATSGGTSGTINGTGNSGTLSVNVNTAFQNINAGQILLEASGNITLTAGTTWNLFTSTGNRTSGTLTLEAGNNITFGNGSSIFDPNNWSVNLIAGYNFANNSIKANIGNIYLNGGSGQAGNGSIQTISGSMTLNAGGGIQLGTGVASSGGGNIIWRAGGDILFGDGSQVTDGNNGSVTLDAGVNNFTTGAVQSGAGNIYLNGGAGFQNGGSIQSAGGAINLVAGRDVQTGAGVLQDAQYNTFAIASVSGSVNLTAGRNIGIGSGYVETTGGGNLNFTATSGSLNVLGYIQTDTGSINVLAGQDVLLDTSASVASIVTTGRWGYDAGGNLVLLAPGGNISVTAVAGSVNAGSNPNGYIFNSMSDPTAPLEQSSHPVGVFSLGGISTAAGGNVNITAGLDIISFLPTGNNTAGDAGSGAFGPQPGNVTLIAGRNVMGHYVVANGTGSITAGNDAGDTSGELALSLASTLTSGSWTQNNGIWSLNNGVWTMSGWTVNAANDINLQEVRNPNGILNSVGNSTTLSYHLFDYGPDDYVNLNAGNEVHLWGNNLPRSDSLGNLNRISIYPPILNIQAGAGGVEVGGEIILFPSPSGSLEISTTGGGSLTGDLASITPDLVMADNSGRWQYTSQASFGVADFAAVPVHENSPTPVALNISGNMNNIYLAVPEAAQINVVGDMNNCSFQGQNLAADPNQSITVPVRELDGSMGTATVYPGLTSFNVGQTAKINMENSGLLNPATDSGLYVGGNIFNLNQYNSVTVSSPPDLSLLLRAFGGSYGDLFNNLFYDPVSGKLTLRGMLGQGGYNALTSLVIQSVDQNGQPEFTYDQNGVPTPVLETVHILDPSITALLQSESQNAPPTPNPGYILGGGGAFDITARTLDLGSTFGIQTIGPANDPALAQYYVSTLPGHFSHGADVNVTLTGVNSDGDSLDMFATTISTLNGGNISVNAAGNVVVGSTYVTGDNNYARGIFTTGNGDVSVIVGGDIEVAGSRIAAYDGGNVTVESLHGNVDAGNGGSGSVTVNEYYVNPTTGISESFGPIIPLSGILAMTFPPRASTSTQPAYSVGNVLVEAPEGSITANAAGIVQLPLNGVDSSSATVTVLAGYELRDSGGNPVDAAQSRKAVVEPLPVQTEDLSDPPQTAIVDGTKYQLSPTVWAQLLTLLGVPGDTQVVMIHVIGDRTDFVAALQGNGSGLANSINYFSKVSSGENINVNGSGVVASNARMDASGNIAGLIVTRNNADVIVQQNANVTVLAQGAANVSAGGNLSGEIIGVGGLSASSGGSIDASLLSQNISPGVKTSGQEGFTAGTAAAAASTGLANDQTTKTAAISDDNTDDPMKKKGKQIALAQKVSRVTVILPPKKI
jgi:filamentous hemagglutinin family protein